MSAFGDRRLVAHAGLELVLANVRYWSTVAPVVRAELAHWERRAAAIGDPEVRALAVSKLHAERFNAEAGAMLASRVPRRHRADAARAIVALELLFDLLDGLTERPMPDPLRDGEALFGAFTSALARHPDREPPDGQDGGYMRELSATARREITRLPAAAVVLPLARTTATRAAEAQIRMHAVSRVGTGQLQQWAEAQAEGTGLQWRELLAGAASSVLAVHALIAAAADPDTTAAQAGQIEQAYLSICVVLTMLDGIVDRDDDVRRGERGYIDLWEQPELADTLVALVRRALAQARELPRSPHHVMTFTGVVAYYASAAGASGPLVKPVVMEVQHSLSPLMGPTLALMRTWRRVSRRP